MNKQTKQTNWSTHIDHTTSTLSSHPAILKTLMDGWRKYTPTECPIVEPTATTYSGHFFFFFN